jgi:hypothetical protein
MTTMRPPEPQPAPAPRPPRRLSRGAWIAIVLGAVVVVVGGVTAGAIAVGVSTARSLTSDTTTRTFPGVREIVVDADEGPVTLRPADGRDVVATAVRHFAPGDEPVVTGAVVNGVLTLRSDCPDFNIGCEVEHSVTVPAGTVVNVRTVDGAVDAAGLDTPHFSATTVAGSVHAAFVTPPGEVRAETVAGAVRIVVPPGAYRVSGDSATGAVGVGVVDDPAATRTVSVDTVTGAVAVDAA